MNVSPVVEALIQEFEEHQSRLFDSPRFAVSRTVSLLAAIYEKARNAVEFRAEHLIRRAAIERILKRRILTNGNTNTIAESLVVELMWALYIDSSLMSDEKITHIQHIIDRYLVVRHVLFQTGNRTHKITWDLLLGLLSSEIEESIVPAKKREALNNFFYQVVRPKIHIKDADEKQGNMLTYIAIERAYAQADDPIIMFHLLKIIQPTWLESTTQTVSTELPQFIENVQMIKKALQNEMSDSLFRYIRKQNPPLLLIRDFFLEVDKDARKIIENEQELEKKLSDIAAKRYHEIGMKVRRSVIRSIIYIFLTKMVFAFALEAPFDVFITKRIEYLSLAINIFFPPILLFVIAGFLSVPGNENTRRLTERVKKIFYNFDEIKNEPDIFSSQKIVRKPVLTAVFSLLYVATFVISFGMISIFLSKMNFNPISQIIFVFFVTLVSFFAYRIRLSAKEYEMIEHHGILTPIVDFFFLPILRVGRILSSEIAKFNVFMFVFDFILEAPLKVIFEVIEEWIRFISTKKDEII